MLTNAQTKYLEKLYYDVKKPAAFSGVNAVYDYVKANSNYVISRNDVRDFLLAQEVYTTHVRKNKPRGYYSLTSLGPKL